MKPNYDPDLQRRTTRFFVIMAVGWVLFQAVDKRLDRIVSQAFDSHFGSRSVEEAKLLQEQMEQSIARSNANQAEANRKRADDAATEVADLTSDWASRGFSMAGGITLSVLAEQVAQRHFKSDLLKSDGPCIANILALELFRMPSLLSSSRCMSEERYRFISAELIKKEFDDLKYSALIALKSGGQIFGQLIHYEWPDFICLRPDLGALPPDNLPPPGASDFRINQRPTDLPWTHLYQSQVSRYLPSGRRASLVNGDGSYVDLRVELKTGDVIWCLHDDRRLESFIWLRTIEPAARAVSLNGVGIQSVENGIASVQIHFQNVREFKIVDWDEVASLQKK